MLLPLAEFRPDAPDLAEATNIALNVIALTTESYGPFPTFQAYTDNQLDNPCLGLSGGFAYEVGDYEQHVFAGTVNKLWIIEGTSTNWADVSGATYNATGENWRFAQFKNLMLATDFNDPVQVLDITQPPGTRFSVLSSEAPQARYITVAKNFVIAANTSDPLGGINPSRIAWSGVNNPTRWPGIANPGSAEAQQMQSDYNDFSQTLGQITGLAANLAGADVVVFFERGVQRGIYVGPPNIFSFYPAAAVRGTSTPNGIVPLGQLVYYPGEDGFYTFDGSMSAPIGASKVDRYFFDQLDATGYNTVIGAPAVVTKAIVWIYRTKYAPDVFPDRALIYRWDIQRWSQAVVVHTEFIARAPLGRQDIVPAQSAGQIEMGAVQNGQFGQFAGNPMRAFVGTKVVQLTPDSRTMVTKSRPLVQIAPPAGPLRTEDNRTILLEAGLPLLTESSNATVTVAFSARNTYYDTELYGPEVPPNIMGDCPQRSDGRYHRARLAIPAGVWTQALGVDAQGVPAGQR